MVKTAVRETPERGAPAVRTDRYLFTSESVTEGHPDKIADQISDGVLDRALEGDEWSRVACETLVTTGLVVVAGEVTTETYIPVSEVVRDTIRGIGYTDARMGFDYHTCGVMVTLDRQSGDIAQGVDRDGAGDQGMMFGYACTETEELMPLPISLAHALTRRLAERRKDGTLPWVRPDGKSQVTVEYDDGRPKEIKTVVVSTQTGPEEEISPDEIQSAIREEVVFPVLPEGMFDRESLVVHVNPTGRFVVGGPQGDAGVTGRKIIVDTYGGMGRHGGGAFSGKDPTKVDRSGAYAARWIAKNLVAAGFAQVCEVQIAYAIGVAEPVSVMVDTFATGERPDEELAAAVVEVWDLRPRAIIEALGLRRPIYQSTAAYGHFGRTPEDGRFTWEKTDRVEDFRTALGG
ncbi:MAG TPA: methionine adenosyltransferase [Gemmatimonadota bacterium]|nr:methionine adenosyltransferase [Gemmatimonadota bacterium]